MGSNEEDNAVLQACSRASTRRKRAAATASTRRKSASTRKKRAAPPIRSYLHCEQSSVSRLSEAPNGAPPVLRIPRILAGLPVYFLFECVFGYVLFLCHNVDKEGHSFESTEEYIKHYKEVFNIVAYYPFQSTAAALRQLTALSNSNATKELIDFLLKYLPKPNLANLNFSLSCGDSLLTYKISCQTKIPHRGGSEIRSILRGLRTNIYEFIDKKPAELEKLQRDLALSFSRQRCKSTYKGNSMAASSSSSFFDDGVVVVPHKFEGVFIAKGKNNDAICTKI